VGEFLIPRGDLVSLNLNEEASAEPGFLDNLTDVKFDKLNFNTHVIVSNESLDMFRDIKHVRHFGLSGCSIDSLKPIYGASHLTGLDVTDTHVSLGELLNCKFFNNLLSFNFGPVKDPTPTLEALAKNDKLYELKYSGPVEREHKTNARGLNKSDVDALIKIPKLSSLTIFYSPQFDDACLEKLLNGKPINYLDVNECGITPKSIPFLKTTKLHLLKITTVGWSSRDQKLLDTLPFQVERVAPAQFREITKIKQEIGPSVGFFIDKYRDEIQSDEAKPEQGNR